MAIQNRQEAIDAIAFDYVVDGERTAAAVAAGRSRLLGITYAAAGQEPCFVAEDLANTLHRLGPRPRVYHDGLFCCAVELANDLPLAASFDDTHIMLHLLQEEAPAELLDPHRNHQQDQAAHVRASLDRVRTTSTLHGPLASRMQSAGLDHVYQRIEIPVVAPTLAMTFGGLRVNVAKLEQIAASHAAQMEIAQRQLHELAGRDINVNSDVEVAAYLSDVLGPPVVEYGATGHPLSDGETLKQLAHLHPAVDIILKYREHQPIRAGAAGLLRHVGPTGMIHAHLDPLGATTGRFSCRGPNLQGLHSVLRTAVEAAPGCVLLEADISQCELRTLAHFSQDPRLLAECASPDIDLHRRTAAAVLGLGEDQVTDAQRNNIGKAVNFAIIYGTSAVGLSQTLGISPVAAQQLLDSYFASYPRVKQWIEAIHDFARAHGFVRTLSGRRRQLPDIWSTDRALVSQALRQSVNTVIQGSAADIIKLALVQLHDALPADVRMLTTCHDSVLLEVPDHRVDFVRQLTESLFLAAPSGFTVPIKFDVSVGQSWAQCKRAGGTVPQASVVREPIARSIRHMVA